MKSVDHLSTNSLKHHLAHSLRKQQSLSNRINVLLIQKQKRFKVIERKLHSNHIQHEHRQLKNKQINDLERSFEVSRKDQEYNSRIIKQIRNELNMSIHNRQSQMISSKQDWYSRMKKIQNINHQKMINQKQQELALKKQKRRQIKLMEMNSKENIRKYWNQRVDGIQEARKKDNRKIQRMVQKTQNSIALLQEKEKRIKNQLAQTSLFCSKLRTECNTNSIYEERDLITWRTVKDQA